MSAAGFGLEEDEQYVLPETTEDLSCCSMNHEKKVKFIRMLSLCLKTPVLGMCFLNAKKTEVQKDNFYYLTLGSTFRDGKERGEKKEQSKF